jgi:hypothetical protein
MLSIIAHQVFGEITKISRSDDLLTKRREEAEKRIVLLKIDLKSARHEPGVSDDLENDLARRLREAFDNRELPPDQRAVFTAALDALIGSKG